LEPLNCLDFMEEKLKLVNQDELARYSTKKNFLGEIQNVKDHYAEDHGKTKLQKDRECVGFIAGRVGDGFECYFDDEIRGQNCRRFGGKSDNCANDEYYGGNMKCGEWLMFGYKN